MASYTYPSIATPTDEALVDRVAARLGTSKATIARILGAARPTVSAWAHGRQRPSERAKAALRFLEAVPLPPAGTLEATGPAEGPAGGAATGSTGPTGIAGRAQTLGIGRLLVRCARHGPGAPDARWALPAGGLSKDALPAGALPADGNVEQSGAPESSTPPLWAPARWTGLAVYRLRRRLGWIQAEMAAFFGTVASTVAVWEDPEPPGFGALTAAHLGALTAWRDTAAGAGEATGGLGPPETLWHIGISAFAAEVIACRQRPPGW